MAALTGVTGSGAAGALLLSIVVPPPTGLYGLATLALPSVTASASVTDSGEGYDLPTLPEPIVQTALTLAVSRVVSGHPLMIFDVPQVVNLTYPAALAYEGTMMNNYPVQRTDFRLVRGATNEVIFFVRDIDRKPVALSTSDSITILIVDPATDVLLMQRTLTTIDPSMGMYQFATLPSEMDTWPTGPVRWSMMYNRFAASDSIMLWTDLSYTPYSTLVVTEKPQGQPAPTITIAWADFSLLTGGKYYSSPLGGAAKDGYLGGTQTFVPVLVGFTGVIEIDASLVGQPDVSAESPDWFFVASNTYTNYTGTDGATFNNLTGNYLWLRIVVTVGSGSVTSVSYKV